jgi:hypothetical protein
MCVFRSFSLFLLMICSVISAADYNAQALELINDTRLSLLPEDCLNRIAYFLEFDDRENDEEFVERASKQKDIPKTLQTKILMETEPTTTSIDCKWLLSPSIDGQQVYRFREVWAMDKDWRMHQSLIKSFDISTFHSEDLSAQFGKMFNFFLDIKCFAISGDEKQLAQLIRHHDDDHLIVCRKIGEEKPYQTLIIPEKYKLFISIGFNKQSTKLIMFTHEELGHPIGESTLPIPDPIKHTLFSLVPESKHEKSSQKTLVGYFAWLIEKYGNQ